MEKKQMLTRGLNAWEETDLSQWKRPESFYTFATNLVLRFFSRPSKAFGIVSRTCVRLYMEVYDLVYPKEVPIPLSYYLLSLWKYSALFHPLYFYREGARCVLVSL